MTLKHHFKVLLFNSSSCLFFSYFQLFYFITSCFQLMLLFWRGLNSLDLQSLAFNPTILFLLSTLLLGDLLLLTNSIFYFGFPLNCDLLLPLIEKMV